MYNMDLWEQSGHAAHYKDAMFRFPVEGQEFGESCGSPPTVLFPRHSFFVLFISPYILQIIPLDRLVAARSLVIPPPQVEESFLDS